MSDEEEIPKWRLAVDNWQNGNHKDAIAQVVTLDDTDCWQFSYHILKSAKKPHSLFRLAIKLVYQQGMAHGEEIGAQRLWMRLDRARIELSAGVVNMAKTGRTSTAQPNPVQGPKIVTRKCRYAEGSLVCALPQFKHSDGTWTCVEGHGEESWNLPNVASLLYEEYFRQREIWIVRYGEPIAG